MKIKLLVPLVILMCGLALAPAASAQTTSTSYWCGSYWSQYPCGYTGYNWNYNYGQNYNCNYTYPYQYYQQNQYCNSYNCQYQYPYNTYCNSYQYQYQYPAPSCTISISNAYGGYGYYNQAALLSWYSSNATSAYIYPNIGSVGLSGSQWVMPYGTTSYIMVVTGPGGTNTCQTSYYRPYPNDQDYYYQYQYQYPYTY